MNHCKNCGNNIPDKDNTCAEAGYDVDMCYFATNPIVMLSRLPQIKNLSTEKLKVMMRPGRIIKIEPELEELFRLCRGIEFVLHSYPHGYVIERKGLDDMRICGTPIEALRNLLSEINKKQYDYRFHWNKEEW